MQLNTSAVSHLSALIRSGHIDRSTPWTFTTSDGNALLGPRGEDWSAFGAIHLGITADAGAKTKAHFHYPVAKRSSAGVVTVYATGLRAAIARAFQQGDIAIARTAQRLRGEARTPSPKHSVASTVLFSALATDLPSASEGENEVQLFPDGTFQARDGRPASLKNAHGQPIGLKQWVMNAAVAARLIASAEARKTPFPIDYEHQSLRTEKNGQPAPAAGWFKTLVYRPGTGLFALVTWTDRARQMIAAHEYRYISPLFSFNPSTGEPVALFNAGLTNNPALDGMDDVALRAAAAFGFDTTHSQELPMKETLIALLGLVAEAQDDAVLAAVTALSEHATELESQLTERTTEIAALKSQSTGSADPSKYVPVAVVEDLRTQIADLSANQAHREVEEIISTALADERGPLLLDAQVPWARELGATNPDALKAYLKTATPLTALRGRQTAGRTPPAGSTAPFDGEQIAVLTTLGLSAEEISSMHKEAS